MKQEGGELARSVLPVWIIDDVSDILGFHLLFFALCPNDRIIRLRLTLAVSITARFGAFEAIMLLRGILMDFP